MTHSMPNTSSTGSSGCSPVDRFSKHFEKCRNREGHVKASVFLLLLLYFHLLLLHFVWFLVNLNKFVYNPDKLRVLQSTSGTRTILWESSLAAEGLGKSLSKLPGKFAFVNIFERTLVIATSAAVAESKHQLWAWLQRKIEHAFFHSTGPRYDVPSVPPLVGHDHNSMVWQVFIHFYVK